MSISALQSASSGLRTVAIVLEESARALETAAVWDLFGSDRAARTFELPPRVELISATPHQAIEVFGVGTIVPQCGLDCVAGADLVFLAPSDEPPAGENPDLTRALRRAIACGSTIVAVDTSVFSLAYAGLLDGRAATTHWSLAEEFAQRFPAVELRPEALYVDESPILTSAGGAATLDLCMYVVAAFLDGAQATRLERQLLTASRRSGRSGQRLDHAGIGIGRGPDEGISDLLDWMADNISLDLSLELLSRHTYMSRRSLTRRFKTATGTTPYAWILDLRVQKTRELLTSADDLTIDQIATRVGFGTAGVLRQHFTKAVGCTPAAYRESARA